jgi:hypothetical protein
MLTILCYPQRHPAAHAKLLELLGAAGIEIKGYSRVSHPTEMQQLVKDGYGVALLREGTMLAKELTTCPIAGVDWTQDTVLFHHQEHHRKTIPVLVRHFTRQLRQDGKRTASVPRKCHPTPENDRPIQLVLLG